MSEACQVPGPTTGRGAWLLGIGRGSMVGLAWADAVSNDGGRGDKGKAVAAADSLENALLVGIELKSNFFGSAREGVVICTARPLHQGRTTQVWDATVTPEGAEKPIAQFRCTQMILWPK